MWLSCATGGSVSSDCLLILAEPISLSLSYLLRCTHSWKPNSSWCPCGVGTIYACDAERHESTIRSAGLQGAGFLAGFRSPHCLPDSTSTGGASLRPFPAIFKGFIYVRGFCVMFVIFCLKSSKVISSIFRW